MFEDTLTQSPFWDADDPWIDWFAHCQRMVEEADQILSIQICDEEDKILKEIMDKAAIKITNVQKPDYSLYSGNHFEVFQSQIVPSKSWI